MDLISIIIVLIILGGLIYLVNLLPIDTTFKLIVKVIAIIVVVIWLLEQLRGANFHI
jgi:preprotein translocase subunit SecE